ncbi:MAG TPA: hypothetical protein VFX02_08870 [Gammaproteobacteria bacterium]|nr:hypothetical protein [Gammaproteobacteria bacterium]
MKGFYWLLKREIWEHRSFVIVPLLMAGVALLFMLAGVTQGLSHQDGMEHVREHFRIPDVSPENRYLAVRVAIMTTAMPLNFVMLILIAVYLLDALYGERRDRSILFWKSLPVSDTSVVLSKLATATLAAPLITLTVTAAAQLIALVMASIAFLALGLTGWGWIWNPLGWLSGWAMLGYGYILLWAVMLPYLAWLLLASAWARRAPFLWAAVPPIALMIFEKWFLGSSHLARLIFGHVHDLLPRTFSLPRPDLLKIIPNQQTGLQPGLEFFAQPEIWGGIFVAVLFIAAAVWLRRYRDET